MMTPGVMAMPADFRYQDVLQRGMPQHDRYDDFSLKHPPMSPARWAKIFAPFDALRGFREAVNGKETTCIEKADLGEKEEAQLNRKLERLGRLTRNMRMASKNKVWVSVTYFVPCKDTESIHYGRRGTYETVHGIVWKVNAYGSGEMLVGTTTIPIKAILRIEADEPHIFEQGYDVT